MWFEDDNDTKPVCIICCKYNSRYEREDICIDCDNKFIEEENLNKKYNKQ